MLNQPIISHLVEIVLARHLAWKQRKRPRFNRSGAGWGSDPVGGRLTEIMSNEIQ